ncbi:hypothetical protein QL285_053946 [Trifolium repens]|nr:hypothetical protein QL285_053924 [Trifolium repens]KAK2404627.1 hypothetical protein QL285_053946 [Trifolium repens]
MQKKGRNKTTKKGGHKTTRKAAQDAMEKAVSNAAQYNMIKIAEEVNGTLGNVVSGLTSANQKLKTIVNILTQRK